MARLISHIFMLIITTKDTREFAAFSGYQPLTISTEIAIIIYNKKKSKKTQNLTMTSGIIQTKMNTQNNDRLLLLMYVQCWSMSKQQTFDIFHGRQNCKLEPNKKY